MILVSTDIPDNAADLPAWLERHLVGDRLADLVAELTAANGPGAPSRSLADLLGSHAEGVRTAGLARLPLPTLCELLRQPTLLLELQEWAFVEGGKYWQRLAEAAPADPAVERGAVRLEHFLAGSVHPAPEPAPRRPRLAWYQQPWLVSLVTAAGILVAVYAVRPFLSGDGNNGKSSQVAGLVPGELKPQSPTQGAGTTKPAMGPPAVGWGWDKPGALAQNVPAKEYLENLAHAAEEWAKKRPETVVALGRRLNQFRAGCSTLILTTHQPLNARDRIWLKDRCIEWAAEIDKALTKLEEDGQVEPVREQADKLAAEIVKALRARAARA